MSTMAARKGATRVAGPVLAASSSPAMASLSSRTPAAIAGQTEPSNTSQMAGELSSLIA